MTIREAETKSRRERFRELLKSDPKFLRDFVIALQNAAPAAWEKLNAE